MDNQNKKDPFSSGVSVGNTQDLLSLITPALDSLNNQIISLSIALNALIEVLKDHNSITDEEMQAKVDKIQAEFIENLKKFKEQQEKADSSQKILTPDDIKRKLK